MIGVLFLQQLGVNHMVTRHEKTIFSKVSAFILMFFNQSINFAKTNQVIQTENF